MSLRLETGRHREVICKCGSSLCALEKLPPKSNDRWIAS
jgi:hypothetical protein